MSILREPYTKKLLLSFLLVFLLTLFLTCTITAWQNHSAWQLLLEQKRAIASSLLEQEVPEVLIAKALNATKSSPEGIQLLNQLGIHENTSPVLLTPLSSYGQSTFLFSLLTLLVSFGLLLLSILYFLFGQERLYQNALESITAYTKGAFDTPLPESQDGSIYRLFGGINHMAGALKAGQEAEHETKEFLLPKRLATSVYCDPVWTIEAMGNVLKNALDHTSQGGENCDSPGRDSSGNPNYHPGQRLRNPAFGSVPHFQTFLPK